MKYTVVFEEAPDNCAAYVPDLPGCVATGATKVEVERKGSVRRAKLTYLRKRLGKGATLVKEKEGRAAAVGATTPAAATAPEKASVEKA